GEPARTGPQHRPAHHGQSPRHHDDPADHGILRRVHQHRDELRPRRRPTDHALRRGRSGDPPHSRIQDMKAPARDPSAPPFMPPRRIAWSVYATGFFYDSYTELFTLIVPL